MVRHLVRLKLRLSRNRLRKAGPLGIIGFTFLWIGAVVGGGLAGLAVFAGAKTFGPVALVVSWSFLGVAWLIAPLIASALDETVEPRRLELVPIPAFTLVTGLLAAAAAGPGAVATFIVLFFSVAGIGLKGATWLLGLLAAVVMLGWCLASSRLLTTLLSDLMRTRRGRDVATLVVAALGAGFAFLGQAVRPFAGRLPSGAPLLNVMELTPPGALGKSVGLLGPRGDLGFALLLLIYGFAGTVLVVWLWSRSLQRLQTRAPTSGSVRRAGDGSLFIPRLLRWIRLSPPIMASAAKELKGIRRDPRMRSQFIGVGVAMVAIIIGSSQFMLGTEYAPLLAVIGGWVGVSGNGFNQFGVDDKSFWAYMVSGVSLRNVLGGKNLALVVLGVPLATILGVAGAIVGDAFHILPLALLTALAVMTVWLAVGNNTSVLGPYPLPESNMFGNRNLPGTALMLSLGGLMAASVLTLPIGILVATLWVFLGKLAALGGSVLALGYGVLIYRLGLKVAGDQLESRSLRMIEILDKDRA